jgi:hypothetical protein
MNIEIYISIWDVDKYGNQIKLLRREKAHSLVAGFNKACFGAIVAYTSANDTSNVPRTIGSLPTCNADAANSNYGLLVGIGNGAGGATAVTINDYKLQSKISHGTNNGQLVYGTHSYVQPGVTGNYCTWKLSRLVTNSSGSAIIITELALIAYSSYYFLLDRTVLAPYSIANGITRSIQYEYRTIV